MKSKILLYFTIVGFASLIVQSCSSTKFIPDGEYLLTKTEVKIDSKVASPMEMEGYIKQKPNFRTFMLFKLPLSIYNLSGRDSTKWINRTLRKTGEPPIIFDTLMVGRTVADMTRAMINKGYLNAEVVPKVDLSKKKAKVTYNIHSHKAYRINDYKINISNSIIDTMFIPTHVIDKFRMNRKLKRVINIPSTDSVLMRNSLIQKKNVFDLSVLDAERSRITTLFRRTGYYAFDKEFIGFVADTAVGDKKVDLELAIYPFSQRDRNGQVIESSHQRYTIKEVDIYVDHNPLEVEHEDGPNVTSRSEREGVNIYYGPRGKYIRPSVVLSNCYIRPGALYDEDKTSQTYNSFSRLGILKNVNVAYTVLANDSTTLRCTITCVPDKKQGTSAEVEGTSSGKFFGMEASLGYLHRNTFKGSELFNIKVRGAYEALSPSFSSFKDNYFEIGGETSFTIPRFIFPFLDKDFKRRIHASTQFTGNYTFQRRPGFFTRTVLSSGVKYIWQDKRASSARHVVDLVDISYVHIPSLSEDFANGLTVNARRYSFTDQFVMATSYTYSKTNLLNARGKFGQPISSVRASIETAGNLLALAAKIGNVESDDSGSKKLFGTRFAQYVKGSADFSQVIHVDEKNTIAWRIGGGLAYPYGNFKEIPIQKRFYSGGANSLRGWGIRELGPGSFHPKTKEYNNFFYHSGDIRMDANLEYRSKVFWVVEFAAFLDAGNIWTVKEYKGQEGGKFEIKSFYKEIAMSWGLGIRLDFDFVLIRLDCGWKAYDPAKILKDPADPNSSYKSKWRIKEPFKFGENTAFHIAVGYPF